MEYREQHLAYRIRQRSLLDLAPVVWPVELPNLELGRGPIRGGPPVKPCVHWPGKEAGGLSVRLWPRHFETERLGSDSQRNLTNGSNALRVRRIHVPVVTQIESYKYRLPFKRQPSRGRRYILNKRWQSSEWEQPDDVIIVKGCEKLNGLCHTLHWFIASVEPPRNTAAGGITWTKRIIDSVRKHFWLCWELKPMIDLWWLNWAIKI